LSRQSVGGKLTSVGRGRRRFEHPARVGKEERRRGGKGMNGVRERQVDGRMESLAVGGDRERELERII